MKIQMKVVSIDNLDGYIDVNTVPFVVCLPENGNISRRQKNFLEKYYDKVVDKRGWVSFYCNVINAWKCKDMGYESIRFPDGKEHKIKDYNLETNKSVKGGKYVVVPYFASGVKTDSLALVKMVRLEVEDLKTRINGMTKR